MSAISRFNRKSFLCFVIGSAAFLFAASAADAKKKRPSEPGLYSLKGWGATEWEAWPDKDINGEVGHPLSVWPPTASCRPGPGWTYNTYIISGSLPPGVTLHYRGRHGEIGGIPTARGHYIVTIEASNIQCNGGFYANRTQQLRFHITGTGTVVQ